MIEELANEHEICDGYLTEKEQHQLLFDEEALREMLEEEARAEKELEERIKMLEEAEARKEQARDELFRFMMLRFFPNPSPNQPFIFDIDGRTLEFGREDFCLITGFRFGKVEIDPKEEDHSEFCKRVFPGVPKLKGEHLLKLINKDVKFNKLDDEDVGEYMWSFFHERLYNVAVDRRKFHLDKLASNPKYEANYVLYGFVFPWKIRALETFSNSLHWWRKSKNVIPCSVAWSNGLKFEKSSDDRLFYSENSSFNKLTPLVLRSATRGIINSKSVHTRVRTKVHHEVRVRTKVSSVVDKEEVHVRAVDKEDVRTRAVDEEDIQERAKLLKTVKEQEQMIVDLQRHLLSTGNRSENVLVYGLDQQSMEGVSQCMNVDEPYKNDVSDNFPVNGLDHQPVEEVSQCTILNDEYESVAVDGLISLRSQDVGHISKNEEARDDPEFKVKKNEEASQSNIFLSTQQVRELINDILDTPSLGLRSVQDDACCDNR
ncbi:hypothetical protein Tco_0705928 [Tanacetum coccineum]|uniref:Uncharacterized protein n=1 Tax=Tanacetum coccineum TaxID=301880 RepID=A0ABQ4Y7H4_9ASTR